MARKTKPEARALIRPRLRGDGQGAEVILLHRERLAESPAGVSLGEDFLRSFSPLAKTSKLTSKGTPVEFRRQSGRPRDIATRPRNAGDEPVRNRVTSRGENNGDSLGRLLGGEGGGCEWGQ
jgi:hypothetical protein